MCLACDLTREQIETLKRTRMQRRRVRALENQWERSPVRAAYRSPQISDMPRGNSVPCGLDGSPQANESEYQMLIDERDALYTLLNEAREIISTLDEKLYDFASHYYLDAMEMCDIAEAINRSIATCWRYYRCIEGKTVEY